MGQAGLLWGRCHMGGVDDATADPQCRTQPRSPSGCRGDRPSPPFSSAELFPSHHVMTTAPAHVMEGTLSIKKSPPITPRFFGRRPAFRKWAL